jgi:ABC-2 type transport system permease protein
MKHEWRNLSADRTVWIVAVLFALIIGYGIYNGAGWASFQKKTINSAAAEEQERLANLRDEVIEIGAGRKQPGPFSDPTLPATVGNNLGQRYAAMPPASLAALSIGQSDLQSYYFKVSTRNKRNFITNDEIENPTNLMSGRFDLAFVVIYLYPLLILALSYNLISGEREQGTLAMLLAQPVSLRTFVLAKVGLRAAVILAMAIIFTVLGIALGGIDLSGEGVVLRLAMWAGIVIAYGAFWFALAIAIGAFGKSSATNAVALAGLWLAFVVLVPSLINITATTAYPVPSRVEMMNATREASNAATAEGSKLLAKYYEDHPELAADAQPDMNDFAARSYAVQEAVDRSIQPVMARYDEQLAEQQKLVNRFRYASPAILVQGALNDIAGTGPDRYRHFLSQVDNFHADWQSFFIPKVFQKAKLTESDYDALPRFAYVEEPAGAVAGRVTVPLLTLSLAALVIGPLAMPVLGRYPLND